jgi:predicted nuclease with TOPRIM domain
MLLNSAQILPIPQSDEESASLRSKMEELNKNTVRLITQAENLVEESKRLSERIKSFEIRSSKAKHIPAKHF